MSTLKKTYELDQLTRVATIHNAECCISKPSEWEGLRGAEDLYKTGSFRLRMMRVNITSMNGSQSIRPQLRLASRAIKAITC